MTQKQLMRNSKSYFTECQNLPDCCKVGKNATDSLGVAQNDNRITIEESCPRPSFSFHRNCI